MKNIILTASILLISTSSIAAPKCYTVTNPQSIIILARAEGGSIANNIIEQANKASVEINNQSDGAKEVSEITLKAESKSMKFLTRAVDPKNDTGYRQFQVDCDGGNALLHNENGTQLLRSDYMTGDVRTSDGCSTGQITIMGAAILSEVSCQNK